MDITQENENKIKTPIWKKAGVGQERPNKKGILTQG